MRGMFYHAYDNYMAHAFPMDELRPISCKGHDTFGKYVVHLFSVYPVNAVIHYLMLYRYSLTLIDALDTLVVCLLTSALLIFSCLNGCLGAWEYHRI